LVSNPSVGRRLIVPPAGTSRMVTGTGRTEWLLRTAPQTESKTDETRRLNATPKEREEYLLERTCLKVAQ
jgi:hypothetical protein